MEDHFFDEQQNNQGGFSPQGGDVFTQEPVQQEVHPEAQQVEQFDDFFGGDNQNHASAQQQQQQPVQEQAVFHQEDHDDFFGGSQQQQQPAQNNYNAFDNASSQVPFDGNQFGTSQPQQNYDMFDATEATPQQISEHEERRLKLQKEDQERTQKLIQKQSEENSLKSQRISSAKTYLANWRAEKDTNVQKRKQACLQEEEVLIESRQKVTYKNPWDKITQNISLKASDYPGAKDVTRMKESILNKKADLQ